MSVGPRKTVLRSWAGTRNVDPIPEQPKRLASKKDTKRWCGGKVGRSHVTEWRVSSDFGGMLSRNSPWVNLLCVNCGKKFDYCTDMHQDCRCGHHHKDSLDSKLEK